MQAHELGYVACVGFNDGAGRVYDVDFVVDKSALMEVTKAFLHKVDGKAILAK